jgi:hypothetical protein
MADHNTKVFRTTANARLPFEMKVGTFADGRTSAGFYLAGLAMAELKLGVSLGDMLTEQTLQFCYAKPEDHTSSMLHLSRISIDQVAFFEAAGGFCTARFDNRNSKAHSETTSAGIIPCAAFSHSRNTSAFVPGCRRGSNVLVHGLGEVMLARIISFFSVSDGSQTLQFVHLRKHAYIGRCCLDCYCAYNSDAAEDCVVGLGPRLRLEQVYWVIYPFAPVLNSFPSFQVILQFLPADTGSEANGVLAFRDVAIDSSRVIAVGADPVCHLDEGVKCMEEQLVIDRRVVETLRVAFHSLVHSMRFDCGPLPSLSFSPSLSLSLSLTVFLSRPHLAFCCHRRQ